MRTLQSNQGMTPTLHVNVWDLIPIVTILDLYAQMSPWISFILNTSEVYGLLAFFTRVLPHPVSISASISTPFRVTGKEKYPGTRGFGDPTYTPRSDLTLVQSRWGKSACSAPFGHSQNSVRWPPSVWLY